MMQIKKILSCDVRNVSAKNREKNTFYCEKVSTFREDLQSPSGLTVATGFISFIDIMNKGKNSSATPQDTSDSLDIKIK